MAFRHMNAARSEILKVCNVPERVDGQKESDRKPEPGAPAAPGASATAAPAPVGNKSEHEKKGSNHIRTPLRKVTLRNRMQHPRTSNQLRFRLRIK